MTVIVKSTSGTAHYDLAEDAHRTTSTNYGLATELRQRPVPLRIKISASISCLRRTLSCVASRATV
eukprot:COSAG01_NODE_39981_length_469_cov_1.154054_1_plen_65_part_01